MNTMSPIGTSIGKTIGMAAAIAGVSLFCALSGAHADDEEGSSSPAGIRLVAPDDDHLELDRGEGPVPPTRAQLERVEALEATARWNRFGTPAALSPAPGRTTQLSRALDGTPEQAARQFLRAERILFRLSAADIDRLEVVRSRPPAASSATAHVVGFRQTFEHSGGRLPAGAGGQITVGLAGSRVTHVTSSAFGSASRLPSARLSADDAWLAAASRLGRDVLPSAVRRLGAERAGSAEWQRFRVAGFAQQQQVRLVALGLPASGTGVAVRPAYEVNVVDVQDGSALATTSFVDALTGEVLLRHDRMRHLAPPLGRSVPCAPTWGGCGVRLGPMPEAPLLAALLGLPAHTTGRAVDPRHGKLSDPWHDSGCDLGALSPDHTAAVRARVAYQRGDFARWAAELGFPAAATPSRVDSGPRTSGEPAFLGRNNAFQVTLQDGLPSLAGHYLFEPVAGRWYGRCADGALDPTLVAHEYAHLLTEHLVGGPDDGITGDEGALLAESWSDLLATEYLLRRGGADPRAIGGYVSGNNLRGIRDHAVGSNPLNATNRGYAGGDTWSDAELWTAVNWDLRDRLGARTWIRLLADSLALQQSHTSMPDARDALLAADRMRFGGAHARRIWLVFAQRGLGARFEADRAAESGPAGADTSPSFTSPVEPGGTLRLAAVDAGTGQPVTARLHVGRFAAGNAAVRRNLVQPLADTDPLTSLPATAQLAAGRYTLTWSAPGYGLGRTSATIRAERTRTLKLRLHRNLASADSGATMRAGVLATTSDTVEALHELRRAGTNRSAADGAAALIDDDETTVWTARTEGPGGPATVAVVDLAGSQPHVVRSVRVSALTDGAHRFSALRRFAVEVCAFGTVRECGARTEFGWRRIYTSPADAFPAGRPRPVPADLTFRDFDIPDAKATSVRLVALANQCTGAPAYHGRQPTGAQATADCRTTAAARKTTIAELMVYDVDPAPAP